MALKSYRLKLPLDVADKLEILADRLYVKPEKLIRLAVEDWLQIIPQLAESELAEQLKALIQRETNLSKKSDKLETNEGRFLY